MNTTIIRTKGHEMNQVEELGTTIIPKIFVLCDQGITAPVWGYLLRQQGLQVVLETSIDRALERWFDEAPDLVVIDVDVIFHIERMEIFKRIRSSSIIPVLFLLPAYHEIQILEAYTAGVDEVVVKPVSPPIFLAKIMAWVRRNWIIPVENLNLIQAGKHQLVPTRRCVIGPEGEEIKLTNLEYRLLHILMSRPGYIFPVDDIIESIWGSYGSGDQSLLKNVVYRLRKKIEDDPSRPLLLQTHQGGYSFQG